MKKKQIVLYRAIVNEHRSSILLTYPTKVTKHCYWPYTRRLNKISKDRKIFDTYNEAREYILATRIKELLSITLTVERANDLLVKASKILVKEPSERDLTSWIRG